MRIAQVAPLYERVPPRLYGGTERVVSWLTEEFVRRGHEVTLFASGDSTTRAHLVPPYPRSLRLDPARPDPIALHTIELAHAFGRAREFDVIHSHVDYLAFPFARLAGVPTLHTMHGRLDMRHLGWVLSEFRDMMLVSISNRQRIPLAHLSLNWVATVYHGLPLDAVTFDADGGRGGYLAFLGRISPEKRPDIAIAVAKRVGLPLKIAAKVDLPDRDYFEREIRPLLDHPLIEYVGELGDDDKWEFLRQAVALLFPIDWPEPFGLAMIEALACGTPVIARPFGSVSEIVREGETGYIAESVEGLAAAVKRLDLIDRRRCRRDVEERFSITVMADAYERVYREIIRGRAAA